VNADDRRAELERLERDRLRALVEGDVAAAARLHADDYELITPGAARLSKDDYLHPIADGSFRYGRFEPVSDVRVRVHEGTAILRYRVRIDVTWPDGEDHGEFWHTDYWERRDGGWQAVWSQATRIRTE
jgi:ketosteroid isomerase-like protein